MNIHAIPSACALAVVGALIGGHARAGERVFEGTEISDEARSAFFAALADKGGAGGFGEDSDPLVAASGLPADKWRPWNGYGRVEKVTIVEIVDGKAERIEKYWEELTPEQFKNQLNDQHTETYVFKATRGGGLSFAGFGSAGSGTADAKADKGKYFLVFNNFKYREYPCSSKDPSNGSLAVGVGLRLTIDATFNKKGFGFGFGPLTISAQKNDVEGTISASVKGLAASVTLSTLLNELSGASVDVNSYENVIKASNLDAVAGASLENSSPITPSIIAYKEKIPGACLAAYTAEFESQAGN